MTPKMGVGYDSKVEIYEGFQIGLLGLQSKSFNTMINYLKLNVPVLLTF